MADMFPPGAELDGVLFRSGDVCMLAGNLRSRGVEAISDIAYVRVHGQNKAMWKARLHAINATAMNIATKNAQTLGCLLQ
jgi:hypothetical protein